MNQATLHRGPEQSNFFHCKNSQGQNLYFGHNRLKIIDLSNEANQPFISNDGRYILIYNGEIYNYQSLKNQLVRKYSFQTYADTEVLFYYLIENPSPLLREGINGMYAFVFYDTQTEKLIIERDKFGIKPLYQFENEDFIIISSEIKGILASGLVEKKLNEKQIYHYLQFKFAQKPATFFEGINEISSQSTVHSPQKPPSSQRGSKKNSPFGRREALDSLLKNALKSQIFADVPVGIFLSGGVDSTLLLANLQELGHTKIPAFTMINSEKEKSFGTADYHFARLAAQKYGAELTEIPINSSLLNHLEDLIAHLDQPIGDSAMLLTDLISKEARKTVKVALSGAGADEIFAGYNRHQAFFQYLKYYPKLANFLIISKKLSPLLLDGFAHPLRKQFRLLKKFLLQIDKSPQQTFVNFTKMRILVDRLQPTAHSRIYSSFFEGGRRGDQQFNLRNALQYDLENYLASDILALTDQMSMRHSLEVRVPYLDNDLVNFAQTLPAEFLLKNGKKWLLKSLLNQKDGRIFTQRSKEGFGIPIGAWIRQKEYQFLVEKVLNPKNLLFQYIDYQLIKNIFQQHLSYRQDYSSEIWAIILLALWLEKEFSNE